MRKLLSLCALAVCFAIQPATAQNDPKAKAVLDGVSKKVSSLKAMKANFALKLSGGKGGKVTDSKSGTITLKGQKYRIALAGQEIICDAKTIWTYNKEAKEVQVNSFNPSEQGMSPAKLLTNFYDKEYRYSYKGERKEAGKQCDIIELTPLDKSKKVAKVELAIDKAASMIVAGKYWEKNGNNYQWTVSNFTPNPNVPDTYFTWNTAEHKGVEVVDLR
ncbi:MAG: outer membrane lipoprotein carrier protein LolA [Bacteroidota bacterium]